MKYHVSNTKVSQQKGTAEQPFHTISQAAALARPGDTVTVHTGTYREWVNPANGGTADSPIVYQSAGDGEVVITGAEPATDWTREANGVWRTEVTNSLFTVRNPFEQEMFGDWLFAGAFTPHLGEVYLDGKSLYECESAEKLNAPQPWPEAKYQQDSLLQWYARAEEDRTIIWANFGGKDPRKENVEISVRPYCFWPEKTGRNYITVRGFTLCQASPQWAPPTALQEGLIGPHWSKGWIIEDNVIAESKNTGISLGKEIETGDNEWSKDQVKGGTQREQEVIFRALRGNWNKENIGSHIVRNNTIHDCEQAGVVGHLGAAFSEISNNRIYNIHHKRVFHGAEVGGIKLHAALDTQICGNVISSCYRAVWLDWQAQGTRISQNVFFDNLSEDFFVEVCHGPYMVDHNLFLSRMNFRCLAQGGAFVHNLFAGRFLLRSEHSRYTPYHVPHETAAAGYSNIPGGDDRFYNNIFLGDGDENTTPVPIGFFEHLPYTPKEESEEAQVVMDGVPANSQCHLYPVGLSMYDKYPTGGEKQPWDMSDEERKEAMEKYGSLYKLGWWAIPVAVGNNVYLNGAVPSAHETKAAVHPETGITVEENPANREVTIRIENPSLLTSDCKILTSSDLGTSYHAEMAFEQPDGKPYRFDTDINSLPRSPEDVTAGPFAISGSQSAAYTFHS